VPLDRRLRLLGVRAGGLCPAAVAKAMAASPGVVAAAAVERTLPLFADEATSAVADGLPQPPR
jgi:hypothetical protein